MTDTSLEDQDNTDASNTNNNQDTTPKTYTQAELDVMMTKARTNAETKAAKKYEGLGDVETLRTLVTDAETRQQEEDIAKGNFEKTLSEVVGKKDAIILAQKETIRGYSINTPLLNAAAKHRSINPEQVRDLLADKVTLTESGEVQVIDSAKAPRYNDSGSLFTVDELVSEFLNANAHFVAPTKSTTNSNSSHDTTTSTEFDYDNIDPTKMSDPKYRAAYAKYRVKHGIA